MLTVAVSADWRVGFATFYELTMYSLSVVTLDALVALAACLWDVEMIDACSIRDVRRLINLEQ